MWVSRESERQWLWSGFSDHRSTQVTRVGWALLILKGVFSLFPTKTVRSGEESHPTNGDTVSAEQYGYRPYDRLIFPVEGSTTKLRCRERKRFWSCLPLEHYRLESSSKLTGSNIVNPLPGDQVGNCWIESTKMTAPSSILPILSKLPN